MARRRFFRVKNWDRFQNFKDGRTPTWIRLYTRLLHHPEYNRLSDAAKSHLVGIWMVAANTTNRLPWDPQWVQKHIQSESKPNLSELERLDFIEVVRNEPERLERVERVDSRRDGPPNGGAVSSVWDLGEKMFGSRPYVGALVRQYGEREVARAIGELSVAKPQPADPRAYVKGLLRKKRETGGHLG